MGESLGPAVRLDPGYEVYWAYVSHFVHAPFYVYAYAFGNLLVEALMEARRRDPQGFAPLYEDLLAAGGARTYVEALAPFGLDPRRKAFWIRRLRAAGAAGGRVRRARLSPSGLGLKDRYARRSNRNFSRDRHPANARRWSAHAVQGP